MRAKHRNWLSVWLTAHPPKWHNFTSRRLVFFVDLARGGAVWQLVGLITRRSQVQILPPQPISLLLHCKGRVSLFNKLQPIEVGAGKRRAWSAIPARGWMRRAQAIVGHSSFGSK